MAIRFTITTLIAAAIYIALTVWVARADYPIRYQSPVAKPARSFTDLPRTAARQLIANGRLVAPYTFARASEALYYDGAAKWRLAATDAPRRSCTGADTLGNSTTCGVLIEGQRVNHVKTNYDASGCVKRGVTATYDSTGEVYASLGFTKFEVLNGLVTAAITYPVTITAGVNDELNIAVDSGAAIPITLTAGSRSQAQIIADINAALSGGTAVSNSSIQFIIYSNTPCNDDRTDGAQIVVHSGTANATIGLATSGLPVTYSTPDIEIFVRQTYPSYPLTDAAVATSGYYKKTISAASRQGRLTRDTTNYITLDANWKREVRAYAAGAWNRYFNFLSCNATNAEYRTNFNGTLWQLEYGEFASSPIPNTSTSTSVTRAADELTVPTSGLINAKQGRLRVCGFAAYAYDALTATTGDPVILHADADFKIIFDESENKFSFVAGGTSAAVATTFAADTEFCLDAVWRDKEKLQIRLNGGAWQYSAADYSEATLDAAMYIGSDATPANHFYGAITKLEVEQ